MIKTGLVSVTFRDLSWSEVIGLVVESGLQAIEWGGDVHVPHGDVSRARDVARATCDAGLEVASYGSYYRVGESRQAGLCFDAVLESALALGTKSIRVWAGRRPFDEITQDYRELIYEETRVIADAAAAEGVQLSFENHCNTLTETWQSAKELLWQVDHSNVKLYWQPAYGKPADENRAGLLELHPDVTNIHVFHWWPDNHHRHLLEDGRDDWLIYLNEFAADGREHYALIEFVKNDLPANLFKDADTLRGLLSAAVEPCPLARR